MCSFFPIPADRFGTKHKTNEISLTNENKRARRERKHRAPTIKSVKKQRQIMDQIADKKIQDIRNLINRIEWLRNNKYLLSVYCVAENIFDNEEIAKIFIESFKERIFISAVD